MIPHTISGPVLAMFIRGQNTVVDATHPNFDQIKSKLRTGADESEVIELYDTAAKLRAQTVFYENNLIRVGIDGILYNDEPLNNYLCDVIIRMAHEGLEITPWVAFLERLMRNPDAETREDLYAWIEKARMPITPDGYFLAYKKVKDDYTSFHDGKTRNDIGSSPFMPRNETDPNRHNECSRGLHFCSFTYLSSYHGNKGKVVVLKVNPADVVAVPLDYDRAKGRAWRYTVVDEVPQADVEFAFPRPVYSTPYDESDGFNLETDFGDYEFEPDDQNPPNATDITKPVGLFGRLRAWRRRFLN